MKWEVKSWSELSNKEIEQLFMLRSEVFVVEQNCIYQDIDGKDKMAKHVLGKKDEKLFAYSRIFGPGDYFKEVSFGRAVVKKQQRGKGLGNQLVVKTMKFMKTNWPKKAFKISAQAHLSVFYKKHGFEPKGKKYLEDGIPHIEMTKNST